jgi:hypothetical protein
MRRSDDWVLREERVEQNNRGEREREGPNESVRRPRSNQSI